MGWIHNHHCLYSSKRNRHSKNGHWLPGICSRRGKNMASASLIFFHTTWALARWKHENASFVLLVLRHETMKKTVQVLMDSSASSFSKGPPLPGIMMLQWSLPGLRLAKYPSKQLPSWLQQEDHFNILSHCIGLSNHSLKNQIWILWYMHSELNMPVSVTNNCDTFNSPKLVPKGCKSNTSPNKCPTPPIQHQHVKNKHNGTILL